jgi:hypothetical protein
VAIQTENLGRKSRQTEHYKEAIIFKVVIYLKENILYRCEFVGLGIALSKLLLT